MIGGVILGKRELRLIREALASYDDVLQRSPYDESQRRGLLRAIQHDLARLETTSDEPLPEMPQHAQHDPLLVDIPGAARLLELSPRQVQRLVAGGELVPVRFGRACRIPVAQLQQLIDRRLQEAQP